MSAKKAVKAPAPAAKAPAPAAKAPAPAAKAPAPAAKAPAPAAKAPAPSGPIMVGDFKILGDLKYTVKHIWAKVDGANIKMGITDFAKKALKEIVFVEFISQEGDTVTGGSDEPIATIESTKAVGEIFAPVSGEIAQKNSALEDDPEANLSDPYGKGWMYLIKPSNKDADMNKLLTPAQYAEIVKKESTK